jgi:hypothetical protein
MGKEETGEYHINCLNNRPVEVGPMGVREGGKEGGGGEAEAEPRRVDSEGILCERAGKE